MLFRVINPHFKSIPTFYIADSHEAALRLHLEQFKIHNGDVFKVYNSKKFLWFDVPDIIKKFVIVGTKHGLEIKNFDEIQQVQ